MLVSRDVAQVHSVHGVKNSRNFHKGHREILKTCFFGTFEGTCPVIGVLAFRKGLSPTNL